MPAPGPPGWVAAIAARSTVLPVPLALSDEEPPADLVQKYANLNFATGFVHAVTSSQMAGKFENIVAYVGGPPPMVDGALRMLVLEARLPGTDIRYDKFGCRKRTSARRAAVEKGRVP